MLYFEIFLVYDFIVDFVDVVAIAVVFLYMAFNYQHFGVGAAGRELLMWKCRRPIENKSQEMKNTDKYYDDDNYSIRRGRNLI